MKPVHQTIFAGPDGDENGQRGDCYAACVASILEMPLARVPNFGNYDEKHRWWWELRRWLRRECDLDMIATDVAGYREHYAPQGVRYAIGHGPSPRGPWGHAVVVDGAGDLAHDPHPSGEGVLRFEGYDVLITDPYEPGPDHQEYAVLATMVH